MSMISRTSLSSCFGRLNLHGVGETAPYCKNRVSSQSVFSSHSHPTSPSLRTRVTFASQAREPSPIPARKFAHLQTFNTNQTNFAKYFTAFPFHALVKHCNARNEVEMEQFMSDVRMQIANGHNVNSKDAEGKSVFYHLLQNLPYVRMRLIPHVKDTLKTFLDNGAKVDDNEFHNQSAIADLIGLGIGNSALSRHYRVLLLVDLIHAKAVDVNRCDSRGRSPLSLALQAYLEHGQQEMYEVIIELLLKGARIESQSFKDGSPYLQIFHSHGIARNPKSLYFAVFAISQYSFEGINAKDHLGLTALDLAGRLPESRWKNYTISRLQEKGAVGNVPRLPFCEPTLAEFFTIEGESFTSFPLMDAQNKMDSLFSQNLH